MRFLWAPCWPLVAPNLSKKKDGGGKNSNKNQRGVSLNSITPPVLWGATCIECSGVLASQCLNVTCVDRNSLKKYTITYETAYKQRVWMDGNNDPTDGCEKPIECETVEVLNGNCKFIRFTF